ncbi:lysophospholipid acyltransferase family protein [Lactiplantibacillus daowaiensis]|uniref:Lysophospholipid acyltransferase family protein n=1 Tax=Lactiplantibacillus daowaiensis TaxID=2559918 RepID=A0ABW1S1G3_9LACO|nr:1-acyl-sn-glycerol-3-phosphate acyltransferase [Lactiplantibacillus daowaiensis]
MWFTQQRMYRYQRFSDDLVTTAHQTYVLPATFQWHTSHHQWLRWLGQVVSWGYYLIRPVKVIGELPRQTSYCLYGNHTQPTGDVLLPLKVGGAQHFNAMISPANLGIPVIGRLLPLVGGLPVPQQRQQMGPFLKAMRTCLKMGQFITIYPEAHVWPYYTGVRPFVPGSFHIAAETQVPVYVMTTTYQASRWHRRPRLTVYIDGPIQAPSGLTRKQRQQVLQTEVCAWMTRRTQASTYTYVHYQHQGAQ